MPTYREKLNDTSLKNFLKNNTETVFKDDRYPGLEARASKDRKSAHFHLIVYANSERFCKKLGWWPQIKVSGFIENLSGKAAELRAQKVTKIALYTTFGDVFTWYLSRLSKDSSLSPKRKTGLRLIITCHLIPALADHPLTKLDKNIFDQEFVLPLVDSVSDSYVITIFRALKSILNRALHLELISHNPLRTIALKDFVSLKQDPVDTRLTEVLLKQVFQRLQQAPLEVAMLIIMMLLHGFRIGETRKIKWLAICEKFITLPMQDVKTRNQFRLPLTDISRAILVAYQQHATTPFLFANKNRRYISPQRASDYVLSISKKQWSAHDCRRFARTQWLELGVDFIIGEMMLNHTINSVSAKYIHSAAEALKHTALTDYHAHLMSLGLKDVVTTLLPHCDFNQKTPQAINQKGYVPAA